jgi:hypothetical protein
VTDEGAPFQPGAEQVTVVFHPRSAYAGYKAFGSGDDAVLVEPDVARELRTAAEFATQEGRVTGGLLFGRGWVDDQGAYLVVNGYLEAGPGENDDDDLASGSANDFILSEADLRLLREDAARMYSARLELGWWRTLGALGEFGPRDFATQAELVGPDGVGLLVYGSGIHWGTAYLGPEGRAPDSAGTLVAVTEPPPGAEPIPDLAAEPAPEPDLDEGPELVDISAGESIRDEPQQPADELAGPDILTPAAIPAEGDVLTTAALPPGTPIPRRNRPRMPSRRRLRSQGLSLTDRIAESPGSQRETPADVQLVAGALALAVVAAAVIVGVLVHSMTVAIVIGVVGVLATFSTIWVSHR